MIVMIMKQEVLSMALGDNIQYLRKVNDITQEELAERLKYYMKIVSVKDIDGNEMLLKGFDVENALGIK